MDTTNSTVTGRKIKIGVVGCGRIASNHFNAIKEHAEHLDLVAVCDIDPQALDRTATEQRVKGYRSLESMLDHESLDVVSICTPSGNHAELTIQAAQRGVHIVTEKPMATKWEDGLSMVKVCEQNNARLFVVKQNRRNATLQLLKEAIEQERFGQIYHVGVNVYWTRPQSYYDQAPWRGTWEMDGGAFMNQASHYVDLLHWLVGPVDTVHAMTATLARNIEAEDTGVVNVKWANGALGSVNVCMLTYPKNLEGSITILGEKGTVKIGGVAVNAIETWEFEDKRPEDDAIKQASYETTSVYGFGHPLYYKNVVDVLQGAALPETDGQEGLKSLELLCAIYQSSRTQKDVVLPLAR